MNENELEEYRSDVATYLLKQMSKGSLFQYAHDKMMQLIDKCTEEELREMMPPEKKKKPKKKDKTFGFS
tara:strand:- start:128 stop:334 length:207 start_codon:yes stop_codon:yes gene_type:complete